jgi:hypothetical protein
MVKKNRFFDVSAPLVGTLGFFTILICLFAALCVSLARFEPDLPLYLDHIQERLTPILQAVQKSSPSIGRLGAWLNPGNILQVSIRGPSGQPSDASLSWTLVNSESGRYSADFSPLVLPLGCGPALCSQCPS